MDDLTVDKIDKDKLSPMMQLYLETKAQYKDCILFYRLGDFYEMFFDDALEASRVLEITLTGKNCGLEERAPMCGVPFHAVETYLGRLVNHGYKVAICEQVEDPKLAKGLVKREVVRVVTPGTNPIVESLDGKRNNYIVSVLYMDDCIGFRSGQCRKRSLNTLCTSVFLRGLFGYRTHHLKSDNGRTVLREYYILDRIGRFVTRFIYH